MDKYGKRHGYFLQEYLLIEVINTFFTLKNKQKNLFMLYFIAFFLQTLYFKIKLIYLTYLIALL